MVIYRESVEIENASKPHFYGQLSPSTLQAFPKNPHIAQLFTQMGRTEELGTGIRKVYKYITYYSGNQNVEFIKKDIFKTKIPLKQEENAIHVTDDVTDDVTEKRLTAILRLISRDKTMSTASMAEELKVSKRTILRDIEKLKKIDKIKYVGSKKSGYWQIHKNKN